MALITNLTYISLSGYGNSFFIGLALAWRKNKGTRLKNALRAKKTNMILPHIVKDGKEGY